MVRRGFLALCLLLFGCRASSYHEGTQLQLGAYIPLDGTLMGVEVVNYLSGCSIRAGTNQAFRVDRAYCSTNSYFWGMVETREKTDTKVEVR